MRSIPGVALTTCSKNNGVAPPHRQTHAALHTAQWKPRLQLVHARAVVLLFVTLPWHQQRHCSLLRSCLEAREVVAPMVFVVLLLECMLHPQCSLVPHSQSRRFRFTLTMHTCKQTANLKLRRASAVHAVIVSWCVIRSIRSVPDRPWSGQLGPDGHSHLRSKPLPRSWGGHASKMDPFNCAHVKPLEPSTKTTGERSAASSFRLNFENKHRPENGDQSK